MTITRRKLGTGSERLRIAIADDSEVWIGGLEKVLENTPVEIAYTVRSGSTLLECLTRDMPDLVVMDVQMPPEGNDAGLVTAREIRRLGHSVPVLILSAYLSDSGALELLQEGHEAMGFLSKAGATDRTRLLGAFSRLAAGETVVDDALVRLLLRRPHTARRLDTLTERERDVLSAMAEGRSNRGIADLLVLSERTVEGHISSLLSKLNLNRGREGHARVAAVLLWLSARPRSQEG